ncbi:IPT/TIG domain-containing protein, partial [Flavobacterium sp. LS2P90]
MKKKYFFIILLFLSSLYSFGQTITSFTPTNACSNSATTVIITGTNLSGALSVDFNGTAATTVTVNSDTQITVILPNGAVTGKIKITTSSSNGTSVDDFTVIPNNTIALSSAAGTDAQTKCISTPITNITYTTTGATGATFSGVPSGVTANWAANVVTISGSPSTTVGSPFSYTVTTTGGCTTPAVTATGTITVTPNNTITRTSAVGTDAQTRCINTAITNITYSTTGATGTTFSGLPTGVTGNWAANVVTISGSPSTT